MGYYVIGLMYFDIKSLCLILVWVFLIVLLDILKLYLKIKLFIDELVLELLNMYLFILVIYIFFVMLFFFIVYEY